MTKDEIIEMAIQARLVERIDECHRAIRPKWIEDHDITTYVEAFAKLVAEKEREACAKIAENRILHDENKDIKKGYLFAQQSIAQDIRTRGQA